MKLKLPFFVILISILSISIVSCSSDDTSTTDTTTQTSAVAAGEDSEYCRYAQLFRDASDEGEAEGGQELVGVPEYVRKQASAVDGLIEEAPASEKASWEKYDEYLDEFIGAIENDLTDDEATNERLGQLVGEAFAALAEVAQPISDRCGFALSESFEN